MINSSSPFVSVFMTTYYHEKYVGKAIESVLSQKVNFPIEIIISDDASEDKTPEILKWYAERYDFIRINLNPKNIGLTANVHLARSLCRGKYICDLSGDDYWIDQNKLQKQVEFLESHEEYFSVCTRFEARADYNENYEFLVPEEKFVQKDFTLDVFLAGENMPMNGMLMRNPFLNDDDKEFFSIMPKLSYYIDDLTDQILILTKGKSYVLPDRTVTYRIRREITGDHNFNSLNKKLDSYKKHIELLNNLYEYFGDRYDLFYRYRRVVFSGLKTAVLCKQLDEFKHVYKTIPKDYRARGLLVSVLCMTPKKLAARMRNK